MGRTKYEDTVYEKVEFSGKIFMYSVSSWNVLFPIVDIIRLLKKNTIIAHTFGKGQQIIRMYGCQYNHCILGYDLKTKKDYLENLKTVKDIFIFSDESDTTATNLMNAAKKNKINVICYSNLDSIYHFYNYRENGEKVSFKTPIEVIEKMYYLRELEDARKYADLFDEFELIDPPNETKKSTLDECTEKMRKIQFSEHKNKTHTKLFDPHLTKLKQMENERSQKNTTFPDSVENLVKKDHDKHKAILARFFKK